MPKVALTEKQAEEQRFKTLSDAIVNAVKERKGRYDLLEEEVAGRIGVSTAIWRKIRNEGLATTDFKTVYTAVRFAGYDLKLEKHNEPKKKPAAISVSKDDTYGTIIEGFIRRIVLETMEEYGQ
ncbi:MAG: hypothetical protein ACI3VB_02235 [Oscillospiraceae bacterium]